MPQFQYKVKKGPDEINEGVLEAESQRAAVARLRDMGWFPISVEPYTGDEKQDKLKAVLKDKLKRVGLKDRNLFFRQLANLLEAGMPIVRALNTLVAQTSNEKMKETVESLRDEVQKGSSFAEAMESHPKLFPQLYISLVHSGESGGMLEEVLWRIVAFGEQEEDLKGKVISALIYPLFLLLVGSTSIFILLSFVFPKFITIFEDFGAELPMPTRIVMGVSDFLGSFWWLVIGIFGLVVYIFTKWHATDEGREKCDRFWLKVPVLRGVVIKYEMAKFSRTLGTLFDNGVPILEALKITGSTMSNWLLREEVAGIHTKVSEGESISDSLDESTNFPPMLVSMLAIGEESGRLGAVTKRIADAYDLEVDRAVKAMAALFEPFLIVVMGVIVGFLVIAMLLPMLTLGANVG